jgi:hypothetical protein
MTARTLAHTGRDAALICLVLLAVVVVSGCSDGTRDETTVVTVVYWDDEGDASPSATWALTCEPPAGSHPDPETACDVLGSVESSVFEPLPAGTRCAAIYGGPARADVTRTVGGAEDKETFRRRNGCEIERWDALEGLLPPGNE